MTDTTKTIEERIDICRSEYNTGGEFKTYIDKLIGVGGNYYGLTMDEIFAHLLVYDICIYYKNKEK